MRTLLLALMLLMVPLVGCSTSSPEEAASKLSGDSYSSLNCTEKAALYLRMAEDERQGPQNNKTGDYGDTRNMLLWSIAYSNLAQTTDC